MSKPITLGIQSPQGQKRVHIKPTAKLEELYKEVQKVFELSSTQFSLSQDQRKELKVENSKLRTVSQAKLKHGDRLFMSDCKAGLFQQEETSSSSSSSSQNGANTFKVPLIVVEDDIDVELGKQTGQIPRSRDRVNCQHQGNSQCVHCIPYDPFDEEYLKEKGIKFMSFHSYLRKLSGGLSKGKFAPLRNMTCKVVHSSRCEHQPYPQGICGKCQPSAVTLKKQPWRHTDSITFENAGIVDRFLQFWRDSGAQRAGWLYGRYEIHSDVPLGIKAVVCAIYEPPQESSKDTLRILEDPNDEVVEEAASKMGLRKVGWIFTDLVPLSNGQVKYFRGMDTHYLSAQEIITSGHYQNLHPNKCKQTEEGVFGSKFVTVCVTGNNENQIDMQGYQVSNQCMCLVKDKILVPTKDAPELGYIVESTDSQYIPDVFFTEKDEYGNEIKKVGRPLPVEYLFIELPVTTPLEPLHTFSILPPEKTPFPVENRLLESSLQDFNAFARYISQFKDEDFFEFVSDLHVLVFMATLEIMPLREYMGPLYEAIATQSKDLALEWSAQEPWQNLKCIIQASI